jgi:hypothetical protein
MRYSPIASRPPSAVMWQRIDGLAASPGRFLENPEGVRYDRARASLDRPAIYIVAAYVVGAAR